jgi:hypothetical protein
LPHLPVIDFFLTLRQSLIVKWNKILNYG